MSDNLTDAELSKLIISDNKTERERAYAHLRNAAPKMTEERARQLLESGNAEEKLDARIFLLENQLANSEPMTEARALELLQSESLDDRIAACQYFREHPLRPTPKQ